VGEHDRFGAAVAARRQQFERSATVRLGAAAEGSRHLVGGLLGPGGKTTRFKLEDDCYSIDFDGLEKVDGASDLGNFHYVPVLFTEAQQPICARGARPSAVKCTGQGA
jgi:hypothetical protein